MRFKILLLTLFAAGLSVSVAFGAPPPGKGKGHDQSAAPSTPSAEHGKGHKNRSGADCRPKVSFILKGDLAAAPAADSFTVNVKRANKHAQTYVGKQVTVMVDDKTKVRRQGRAKLSDLQAGDLLNVQVRACKSGDAASAAPQLLAKRVNAHPASAGSGDDKSGDDGAGTTTSTTTPTTTTTTTDGTTTTTTP